MPHLYDCFLFYNELDLLEIRLNELSGVADKFVLAEATTTFTGKPKPLFFSENKERFRAFNDRIIHIVIEDQPNASPTAWERQIHQRNALVRGIGEAAPDDLILLSDVDEIPRADAVRDARNNPPGKGEVVCFELRMYNYFVNLECEDRWLRNGPRLVQKQHLNGFENLRRVKGPVREPLRDFVRGLDAWKKMGRWVRRTMIPDSGWHFTYTGGIEAIQKKINSYSGHDKVSDEIRDPARLVQRISDGYSVDTRHNTRIEFRPLDATFPRHLLDHRERFSKLILESPEDLRKKLGALR